MIYNLYQHNNSGKEWDIDKISKIIKDIINTIKNSTNFYSKEDKLYTPFSKAMDYNGFSQRTIIDTIKEEVVLTNLSKRSLPEIETEITEFMMEEKKKYARLTNDEKKYSDYVKEMPYKKYNDVE